MIYTYPHLGSTKQSRVVDIQMSSAPKSRFQASAAQTPAWAVALEQAGHIWPDNLKGKWYNNTYANMFFHDLPIFPKNIPNMVSLCFFGVSW